jgi:seryl-tRNA synthetase
MLDIKLIRQNPEAIEKKLKTKEPSISLSPIIALDSEVRALITRTQDLQNKRNFLSKEIGEKKQKKEDCKALMQQIDLIKEEMAELEKTLKEKESILNDQLGCLPNLPQDTIPISLDKNDNVCVKTYGKKREFDFPFKNHLELNEKLHLFDFTRATKMSGTNWPCYTGIGARLEWAIINYMLDCHIKNGFKFIMPPLCVKENIMYGSGQLPKFESQLYKTTDEDSSLYLIPTAEIPLTGLHYDEILEEKNMPMYYVSYTPCFRKEAGAAGKQERGLIRMHQFNKVELYAITTPEKSEEAFEKILSSAEKMLQGLEMHYRNMLLVTGDMSFGSTKTIDVEVFLPGQERYYEVSSVSNCGDFQARRSKIRYKNAEQKMTLVHTLNGSGVATSRLMVALLENNQQKDGSIKLPTVLHKYLEDEITVLKP